MKIATHFLAAIIAALCVLLPIARKIPQVKHAGAVGDLSAAQASVDKNIADMSQSLAQRLAGLGAALAQDREFSMKMLVERDPSAPEVTEIAGRYMAAMGLSVLDIADAEYTVLSSGHFPARAGLSAAHTGELLGEKAAFIVDDIAGKPSLTLQAKVRFICADVPFYCMGGIMIDTAFLAQCTPRDKVVLILKRGSDIMALQPIGTISGIKKGEMVMDDAEYLAGEIPLNLIGSDIETAQIIVAMKKPAKAALFSLF